MSQYHNGEACTNCNVPAQGYRCRRCGYPMCKSCYKSGIGKCSWCKREAKVTLVGNMDNNYDPNHK